MERIAGVNLSPQQVELAAIFQTLRESGPSVALFARFVDDVGRLGEMLTVQQTAQARAIAGELFRELSQESEGFLTRFGDELRSTFDPTFDRDDTSYERFLERSTAALAALNDGLQLYGERQLDSGEIARASAADYDATLACLLYTSPSPRDRTRSRMPSSA